MKIVILFVCACAIAMPGVASAQTRKIPPSAMAKAKERFEKGQALHHAGHFEEAIVEYQAAYALAALPDLLFNLGQVYRLNNDRREALDAYLKYLEAAPAGRGAEEARGYVSSLSRDLRVEEETRRRESESRREQEEAAPPRPAVEPPRVEVPHPAAPLAAVAPSPPPSGSSAMRIAGLVTAGAGVVAIGAGVAFGLRARALSERQGALTVYDPGLVAGGKAANRNMALCLGAGGAAVVTGGVLYLLGGRSASVTLAPEVGPSGGALSVAGSF